MRALIAVLCLLTTPALADLAGVASVIDGDTIAVHGHRIRLHGIDAPVGLRSTGGPEVHRDCGSSKVSSTRR